MAELPDRTKYGTFSLGSETPGGVVHLRSELPELIALGKDAFVEIENGVWPLGGPHAEIDTVRHQLHFTTPECRFSYQAGRRLRDSAGWYMVMRLVYVSPEYDLFLEQLQVRQAPRG